jgi:hypothetical protein
MFNMRQFSKAGRNSRSRDVTVECVTRQMIDETTAKPFSLIQK